MRDSSKGRVQAWLAVIVVGVGLVFAAILGLFTYIKATATPLHPDPRDVSSITRSLPIRKWADSVEQARQLARAELVEQNLPGLSVAVGAGGDIVWAEGFGWADVDGRVPVAPEMRFRTGGVSMTLTSAAVGLLLEKGRLNLDDEIQTYVSAFPRKEWPVTLRQLMGHVAGVRGDMGDEEPLSERCPRTVDGLQRFAERPLIFEPGTEYRYSTYGWMLVSAAVEDAAGQPFFTFMRSEIFQPLGMDDTAPDSAKEQEADRAATLRDRPTFYYPRFSADTRYGPELAREGDYACFAGAGAFVSTPSDLVRFGMAIDSGKLLQRATVSTLQASQKLRSGAETGYGLGWDLETVSLAGQTTQQVGHDGEFFIGGSTSFIMFPERDIVVSVATNTSFADTSSLALKIAQAFAEQGNNPARK